MHIQNCYHSRAPCCHSCSPSIISFPLFPCLSYPSLFRPSCIFLIHHLRLSYSVYHVPSYSVIFLSFIISTSFIIFVSFLRHLVSSIPLSRIFLLRHLRFFCLIPALSIRDSRTSYFSSFPRFIFVISSFHIRHSRTLDSSFPYFRFVIPAKAGIQQTNLFHTLL